MPGPVSTCMGDCQQAAKPSRHITNHPGQLSLVIPLCVSAMHTGKSRA